MNHEIIAKEAKKIARREGAIFKYAKTYYDGAYYLLLNNEAFDIGFSVKYKYQEFGFIEIYENCDSPIVSELNLKYKIDEVVESNVEKIVEIINGFEYNYSLPFIDNKINSIIVRNLKIVDPENSQLNPLKTEEKLSQEIHEERRRIAVDTELTRRLRAAQMYRSSGAYDEDRCIKVLRISDQDLRAWEAAGEPNSYLEQLLKHV